MSSSKTMRSHVLPRMLVMALLGLGLLAVGCRPTDEKDAANAIEDYFKNYTPGYNHNNNNNDNGGQEEDTPTPTPTPTEEQQQEDTPTPTPTATATPTPTPTPEPTATPLPGIEDFSGVNSVAEVSDTTVLLGWNFHEDAAYYVIFKKELAPIAEEKYKVVTNLSAGQTSYLVTGLKINTQYSFKIHAYNQTDTIDTNEITQTVQTSLAPRVPVSVMLTSPASSPSAARIATFTVRYVKEGETVKIFKDSACTQELGSGVVGAGKTSIEIATAQLDRGTTYEVYANATNIYGYTSACSSAYATYKVVGCPENYIQVESNEDLGTNAFCVMKTEARKGANNIPAAQYSGSPWTKITPTAAKAACQTVVAEGLTCDLISNPEWMVLARDIEATAANWSGGLVGSGMLNRGHSDGSPAKILTITDSTDPWTDTGNDNSTWSQKRTHVLSTGDEIWDLAGNAQDIVDWTTGGDTYSIGPKTCAASSTDFYNVNCAALSANDYMPANPGEVETANYNAENAGLGRFYGTGTGNGAVGRGEQYNKDFKAGIYALSFNLGTASSDAAIGFRCVCR